MVKLVHEIWVEYDEDGKPLDGMCLAGPDGDGFRALLAPGAQLVYILEGGSHFESMTLYYQLLGRGTYTTNQPWDTEPYPEEWLTRQKSHSDQA